MLEDRPNTRNHAIDLLRGASIVLVVMHHLAIRLPLTHTALSGIVPHRLLEGLCWNGYESVFVFFVISGFLITGNALRRWQTISRPQFAAFYRRRASRILPCLVLLVALLSLADLCHVPDFTIDNARQTLPRAIVSALFLHLNWYEGRTGYLPGGWDVLWSLSIEEVFYIAFPIACLIARMSRTAFVALLVVLALSLPFTRAALAGNEIWQEKSYLPGMAAIATGVLAALCAERWRRPRHMPRVLIAGGLSAYFAVLFVEDLIWKVLAGGTMLLLTTAIAALLVGLHWAKPLARLPAALAWLAASGRLSYEIYLTHMAVVFPAVRLFRAVFAGQFWAFVLYPAVLAVALTLGWSVMKCVSQPTEQLVCAALPRQAPMPLSRPSDSGNAQA